MRNRVRTVASHRESRMETEVGLGMITDVYCNKINESFPQVNLGPPFLRRSIRVVSHRVGT